MFAGTGSDVGKSIIAAAFCRILKEDGYSPAPFKAQNMALNSYATPEGYEIGRAQAVQAAAAGIDCHTDMNPILLKPGSDMTSQVILNGIPYGNQDAYSYFKKEGKEHFRNEVNRAFDRLNSRYNPIILEGAGSIAELNLKDRDLVNLSMAKYSKSQVILVADIDRGGVFASLYGTLELLDEEERKMVKGIIINKFRGDIRLFSEGREIIERICKVPVLGVIPYFRDIHIEDEDSVALSNRKSRAKEGEINIAVLLLKHISNFTDFDPLDREEGVNLFYTNSSAELERADIIMIPGSKSTISDMLFLRERGLDITIKRLAAKGRAVIGICGGYQIMGEHIEDPHEVEGSIKEIEGLGILPVATVMDKTKSTHTSKFSFMEPLLGSNMCTGYEIHMGVTAPVTNTDIASNRYVNRVQNRSYDGYMLSPHCFGTYMHGIFDNPIVRQHLLRPFGIEPSTIDYHSFREDQFHKLALLVRENCDMDKIYQILKRDQL